jgi:2-methylcitrate dehydratase
MHNFKTYGLRARHFLAQQSSRGFSSTFTTLPKNTNQARGIGEYAIDFMRMDNKRISEEVYERVGMFHTDSVICGVSALAMRTNAPNILRDEAIKEYSVNPSKRERPEGGAAVSRCFGSKVWVHAEKAIVANCSAVREWDSNGTVFGYDPNREGHNAGEFGHNDFYPVVIAACHS